MLGDKLVALRKKNGHSQQELADRLQVTRQTISNWELGQGAPSLDKAMELAKIYHISLDDLVENQVEIVVNLALDETLGDEIPEADGTVAVENNGTEDTMRMYLKEIGKT